MASGQAQSQSSANYPTKPVRFVCVTAPGGGLDVIGRIVAVGAQPVGKSPPEFEAMLKADYEATQKLVAQIGLKVD